MTINEAGITPAVNGKKVMKKTRRKPLSQARRIYEEDFPNLSCRVDRGTHMTCMRNKELAKMNLKEYLTSLINDDHKYIEEIRAAAIEEGKQSRQNEIDEAYQRGKREGKTADADRIRWETERADERRFAIYFRCANHEFGCTGLIPIERASIHHLISAMALEQQRRWLCPTCQWEAIKRKYDEPPPPPRPSFWPLYYPWPPPPLSKNPP